MTEVELRRENKNNLCGWSLWHPKWMQQFANPKWFMIVFGLLGTTQAMSSMYFVVTLTTIEKRFKIPSRTTGIMLSGNEISQILLSLILSYFGGQSNRPRWIAWGIIFSGISAYILTLPHFIYGAGQDALHLTKEYMTFINNNETFENSSITSMVKQSQRLCSSTNITDECDSLLTIVPLVLIFISQFVLGIGTTLYFSLGNSYLDDNTKKTNTPLMLASAMSIRMIGPILGFFLGFAALNVYIDPSKSPAIDNKDPRWLGAWWLGWIVLGTLNLLFSVLIGSFPKDLPRKSPPLHNSHIPEVLKREKITFDDPDLRLGNYPLSSNITVNTVTTDLPKLKDFPTALMRLLRNKILMSNIFSAIFFILGAAGPMTFLTKYIEVLFNKNAQSATIIVGPVTIVGIVIGFLLSGVYITKRKPTANKVLLWNIVIGVVFVFGQFSNIFLYCENTAPSPVNGTLNLSTVCNKDCSCDGVPYSPVHQKNTGVTFFSPCHAGCYIWNPDDNIYSNCSCLLSDNNTSSAKLPPKLNLPKLNDFKTTVPILNNRIINETTTQEAVVQQFFKSTTENIMQETTDNHPIPVIHRRSLEYVYNDDSVLYPGVFQKSCNFVFILYSILSVIINFFGATGRIGSILVNYRAVLTEDKSFAQGLTLMLISLFALIPGPIIFGRIIDSTCLIWTNTCNGIGNCQLYDQTSFRYLVNILSVFFIGIGLFFDIIVWYQGRHLDLYNETKTKNIHKTDNFNQPITPLLSRNIINQEN